MTRVVLCAAMAPIWPGHEEGVLCLPRPGMAAPDLAAFLSASLSGEPVLLLVSPEGPSPGSVALARCLAGLAGRATLRRLEACGLAASTIARICAGRAELGPAALDGLAVLLDARIPCWAAGQTPIPAWIGQGAAWLRLPGLWWLWRRGSPRVRASARPPVLDLEGVWEAETPGGLPPAWWPADGPTVVWHDGLAEAWRPGWVSLAQLPTQAELEQLLGSATHLNALSEVAHGSS